MSENQNVAFDAELCGANPEAAADRIADLERQLESKKNVEFEGEIARIVQSVNEWDDRTSPDDYPDHLLITSEELSEILQNFASTVMKGVH